MAGEVGTTRAATSASEGGPARPAVPQRHRPPRRGAIPGDRSPPVRQHERAQNPRRASYGSRLSTDTALVWLIAARLAPAQRRSPATLTGSSTCLLYTSPSPRDRTR